MFLAIGGALGASIFTRLHGTLRGARHLLQRIGTLALYSAAAAAAYVLFVDAVFGALTGHAGWLFLALWGYTLAIALAASGVSALLGTAAGMILALLFVLLGNTSAGGAVGRPLLNPFFSALTPILPHGAGLSVIRGIQYFDGHGIGAGVLHLTLWGTAGITLLAVAAARGKRTAEPAHGSINSHDHSTSLTPATRAEPTEEPCIRGWQRNVNRSGTLSNPHDRDQREKTATTAKGRTHRPGCRSRRDNVNQRFTAGASAPAPIAVNGR